MDTSRVFGGRGPVPGPGSVKRSPGRGDEGRKSFSFGGRESDREEQARDRPDSPSAEHTPVVRGVHESTRQSSVSSFDDVGGNLDVVA